MSTISKTRQHRSPTRTEKASLRQQMRVVDRQIRRLKEMMTHMPVACREVRLPASTERSMLALLHRMSAGSERMSLGVELTTQEAADIMGVSRPFLIKQIRLKKLVCRKVGAHRRISYKDLMDYKARMNEGRLRALQELADQAQELDMGY